MKSVLDEKIYLGGFPITGTWDYSHTIFWEILRRYVHPRFWNVSKINISLERDFELIDSRSDIWVVIKKREARLLKWNWKDNYLHLHGEKFPNYRLHSQPAKKRKRWKTTRKKGKEGHFNNSDEMWNIERLSTSFGWGSSGHEQINFELLGWRQEEEESREKETSDCVMG